MTTTQRDPRIPTAADFPEPRRYEDDDDGIDVREIAFEHAGHRTHLVHNMDLGVMLDRGQNGKSCDQIPTNVEDMGLVVVSLDVGGEHDEIHFSTAFGVRAEEVLTRAVEALTGCRDALARVRQA